MRGRAGVAGDPRPAVRADENPDRKAQFAFVRPALSPDPRVRDAFFDSLGDVANRRREPWVLEGLSYLHHPLRAAASREVHPPQPRDAARDPADRRHLLSEALDGRDAHGPQLRERRADGPGVPRRACRRTIRSGCGGSSCRRPTISSERAALKQPVLRLLRDASRTRCRRARRTRTTATMPIRHC